MNHIETTHKNETNARELYKEAKSNSIAADDNIASAARELLDICRNIDELELKASAIRGLIMGYMKENDTLVDADGSVLAKWVKGNASKKVDYKAIFKKYKVSDEDIAANTKVSVAGRKFSLELN